MFVAKFKFDFEATRNRSFLKAAVALDLMATAKD